MVRQGIDKSRQGICKSRQGKAMQGIGIGKSKHMEGQQDKAYSRQA
jgi:hypothetical protein